MRRLLETRSKTQFLTRFFVTVLMTAWLLIVSASQPGRPVNVAPVAAQPAPLRRVNPAAIATQIYQQQPDLPRENQYIHRETGQAAIDDTLVSRIIRYHLYTKNRPSNFRLDWKLTLADYLGVFERILADQYPNYYLRENPMMGDTAAVQALSQQQRDRLVNALYEAFTTPEMPDSQPS